VDERATLRGKKLLLVEDHEDTRSFLEWTFQSLGATTLTAVNTDEASRKAIMNRPDLIVCDIGLPGESGLQFVNWLRQQPTLRATPCVAITAYSTVYPEQNATQFDAYCSNRSTSAVSVPSSCSCSDAPPMGLVAKRRV
jgi:CheY-like chemotaxis protein